MAISETEFRLMKSSVDKIEDKVEKIYEAIYSDVEYAIVPRFQALDVRVENVENYVEESKREWSTGKWTIISAVISCVLSAIVSVGSFLFHFVSETKASNVKVQVNETNSSVPSR